MEGSFRCSCHRTKMKGVACTYDVNDLFKSGFLRLFVVLFFHLFLLLLGIKNSNENLDWFGCLFSRYTWLLRTLIISIWCRRPLLTDKQNELWSRPQAFSKTLISVLLKIWPIKGPTLLMTTVPTPKLPVAHQSCPLVLCKNISDTYKYFTFPSFFSSFSSFFFLLFFCIQKLIVCFYIFLTFYIYTLTMGYEPGKCLLSYVAAVCLWFTRVTPVAVPYTTLTHFLYHCLKYVC